MAFKEIKTQEEFDAAIKERLEREKASLEKKYSDYDALKADAEKYREFAGKDYEKTIKDLNEKLNTAQTTIAGNEEVVKQLTARAETAEQSVLKSKIAHEFKVPYELAGRLHGSNEEEIRKDAEILAKFVSGGDVVAPLASTEGGNTTAIDAAYASLYNGLAIQK